MTKNECDRSPHLCAFGISLKHVCMHFSYLDIKPALLSYFLICYLPGVQKQVNKNVSTTSLLLHIKFLPLWIVGVMKIKVLKQPEFQKYWYVVLLYVVVQLPTTIRVFSLKVKASKYLHAVFIYMPTPRGVFEILVGFKAYVVLTVSQLICENKLKSLRFVLGGGIFLSELRSFFLRSLKWTWGFMKHSFPFPFPCALGCSGESSNTGQRSHAALALLLSSGATLFSCVHICVDLWTKRMIFISLHFFFCFR